MGQPPRLADPRATWGRDPVGKKREVITLASHLPSALMRSVRLGISQPNVSLCSGTPPRVSVAAWDEPRRAGGNTHSGTFKCWVRKRGKKGEGGNADAGLGKSNSSIKQTLSRKHDAISISARVVKYLLKCCGAVCTRLIARTIRGTENEEAFRNKRPCFSSQSS